MTYKPVSTLLSQVGCRVFTVEIMERTLLSHVVMHKGDKLSQISAATSWGETIYLGSPFDSGVYV